MTGLWRILKQEYLKQVREKRFWISTLGLPFMLAGLGIVALLAINWDRSPRALGMVDPAGVLGLPADGMAGETRLVAYPDLERARQAILDEQVRGAYIIPADYLQGGQVQLYMGKHEVTLVMRSDFEHFARTRLVQIAPGHPPASLFEQPRVAIHSLDQGQEFSAEKAFNLLMAFGMSYAFTAIVSASSSRLLNGIAEEKFNRMLEVLLTSVSPEQLLGGKALGLLAVCLTQFAVWAGMALGTLLLARRAIDLLNQIEIPWNMLLLTGAFFLPSFALIAAIMMAIGGVAGEVRQAQQIAQVFNLVFMLPLFLSMLLMISPNSRLAVGLTLFPATALTTIALRWGFTTIPAWQLVTSWGLLAASTLLAIWAAARLFRMGMLMYGQGPSLRAIVRGLGIWQPAARLRSR